MKTMRNAFLAAGLLAALTLSANAQSVSDEDAEVSFLGNVDVQVFRRPNGTVGTTPANVFNPRQDLPLVLAAYGVVEGGQLFTPPAVDFGPTDLFTSAQRRARDARYTFSVTNLTVNPASIQSSFSPGPTGALSVTAQYTGGIFEVWFDPNAGGVAGDLQNYSEGSQGSFRNGTRILYGDVVVNSGYTIPNDPSQTPFGTLDGTITFNTALGSGPINQFLMDNPQFTTGVFSNTGYGTGGRPNTTPATFSEYSMTGQIELLQPEGVIPEPTTMALFGAGLLPLGAFLRRRRGA